MEIFLGPPGTGKTTTLLGLVDEALAAGTRPDRIAFVSFTKKAASEAVQRACERFGLNPGDFPHFRTLHSMAFRALGMKQSDVLGRDHFADFSRIIGEKVTGSVTSVEGTASAFNRGDRALFLENLARVRGVSVIQQWRHDSLELQWLFVDRIARGLAAYKKKHALFDFSDMITMFNERGGAPPLDLLIVDEAQDLSHEQWRMVYKLAEGARRVVVAGDDDQAIFGWAGADVEHFIGLPGSVTVLGQSYRVPKAVQGVAAGVIDRVSYRRPKEWAPRDEDGSVDFVKDVDHIDMSQGSWLALARNNCFLTDAEAALRKNGLYYDRFGKPSIKQEHLSAIRAWEHLRSGGVVDADGVKSVLSSIKALRGLTGGVGEFDTYNRQQFINAFQVPVVDIWHEVLDAIPLLDRSYMVAALRRGEKITKTPRIHLSTIHGAKGGEADNVVLFTDVAERTYQSLKGKDKDEEARVFYVGVTRARKRLFVVLAHSPRSFSLARK